MLKKLLAIFTLVSILAVSVLAVTGCSPTDITASPGGDKTQIPDVVIPNKDIVENFVKNSATYRFDGIDGSIKLVDFTGDAADVNWVYTVEYQTAHPGHGDRSGQILAQVITTHTAVIKVTNGEITSAVCDDSWDMLSKFSLGQEFKLSVGQSATLPGQNMTIKFDGVSSDSRSPKGAQTIWAGEAKINLTIELQGVSSNVTLTEKGLTEGYTVQQFEKYSISFKLLPYPEVNKQPAPDAYELTLKIDPAS